MLSLPAGQTVAPPTTETTQQLHGILRTLQRRMRPMLAIFFGFVALVVVFSLILPKSYTTDIKVIAGNSSAVPPTNGDNTNSELPVLNALLAATGVQSAETYVELFQENPVVQEVMHNLNINMSTHEMLKHVNIKPVTNTSIIDLAVTWSNPRASARIANEFGRVVMEHQRQAGFGASARGHRFSQQAAAYSSKNNARQSDEAGKFRGYTPHCGHQRADPVGHRSVQLRSMEKLHPRRPTSSRRAPSWQTSKGSWPALRRRLPAVRP